MNPRSHCQPRLSIRTLSGRTRSGLVIAVVVAAAALSGRWASAPLLALLVAGLGLLLLLRQPGLGLLALAALSFTLPFTLGTGTEVALTPPVFLIAAATAAWLLAGLGTRSLRLPAARPVLPLLLFLLAGLLSLLAGRASWDPHVPRPANLLLVQLGQWALFALSAAAFLLAADLGRRGPWLRCATWTFLALASVVVLEFYLPPLRRALGWSRPEMASRSMFWTWLPALAGGQLLFNRHLPLPARLWLLALLLAAAAAVWVPLAGWVSGWAPFAVSLATLLWLRLWRASRPAALLFALLLALLALLLFPLAFSHAGGQRELDVSGGGRLLLYRAVLHVVQGHPLLGLGPAAYRTYAATRWLSGGPGQALWLQPQVSSHNNYLDLYAQLGLIGLALFLWFLVELALLNWRLLARLHPSAAAPGDNASAPGNALSFAAGNALSFAAGNALSFAAGNHSFAAGNHSFAAGNHSFAAGNHSFAAGNHSFAAGYLPACLAGLAGTLVSMLLADWFLPLVHNTGFAAFRTSALAWLFLGGLLALQDKVTTAPPVQGRHAH